MVENPYASPVTESRDDASAEGSPTLGKIAKSTFLAWERLRVVYLVLLGLLTVLLAGPGILQPRIFFQVIGGAIVANLCFFLGPIIETYVRWLGYQGRWVRVILFISGTLLTAGLAVASLATLLLPNQN